MRSILIASFTVLVVIAACSGGADSAHEGERFNSDAAPAGRSGGGQGNTSSSIDSRRDGGQGDSESTPGGGAANGQARNDSGSSSGAGNDAPDSGSVASDSSTQAPEPGTDATGTTGSDAGETPAVGDDAATGQCTGPWHCRCDEPGCGACPDTAQISMGDYSIDAHEVTNADYLEFAGTNPPPSCQPGFGCSDFNTLLTPPNDWPPPNERLAHPVAWVSWCSAYAYCVWARKRLCGDAAGGELTPADYDDETRSQWYNACSAGDTLAYPYGGSYDPEACNGQDHWPDPLDRKSLPVTSMPSCEGGVPGLYDMSGNMWEWEDSCVADGETRDQDTCYSRGGSFYSTSLMHCRSRIARKRSETRSNVGFRCCTDL